MHRLFKKNSYCVISRNGKHSEKSLKTVNAKIFNSDNDENYERRKFNTHMKVIKNACEKKLKYCVIFDDVIDVSQFCTKQNLDIIHKFIKNNNNWDIFYLNYNNGFLYSNYNSDIIHIKPTGSCAYIVSQKFMKKINKSKYHNENLASFYSKNAKNCYALKYRLFNGFRNDFVVSNNLGYVFFIVGLIVLILLFLFFV